MQPKLGRFELALIASFLLFLLLLISTPAAAGTPITECASPVQNVTPSTLASSVGGSGCKTLVLGSGTYSRLNISNRSTGVLTLRCATVGQCAVGNGSVVSNVNGVIIDGITITGGTNGLTIKASKNVLVRNSTFVEQTSAGLTANPGSQSDNIQIYDNEFRAATLGCQYGGGYCYHFPNGEPIAEMDYGVRIYDTRMVEIKGNRFGVMFNHAISLKYSVVSANIENNMFNSCGRTCNELGQNTPVSGEVLVTGNTFSGQRTYDNAVGNIKKAMIINNTFITAKAAVRLLSGPSGRVVISSPNTFK